MKTKKILLLFLPYLIFLFAFGIYLIIMAIFLKIDREIAIIRIFAMLDQVFLTNPSYLSQLCLVILCLILFWNTYIIRKQFAKKNIQIENQQKNNISKFLALITILFLIFVFIINIMIVFINQNYYFRTKGPHSKNVPIKIENIKILEYLFTYVIRLSYWFLLTTLLIKITNSNLKVVLLSFIYPIIMILAIGLGLLLYGIVHNWKVDYRIILFSSLIVPEIINSMVGFDDVARMVSETAQLIYLVNLVYLPSLILFISLVCKLKFKEIKMSNKKILKTA
ncbi:hypothetical protein [Metamycoplasma buccale]|uniref:hypothetical protein n=1 Tax=Metamycoplasma buccale TaxID=55602 RepID=UPI00398EBDE3